MELNSVIIKPYRTEKVYQLQALNKKKYVFIINRKATKELVKQAFEEIYGIKPESVNILIKKPTKIRTGSKKPGWSKLLKIAYVSLPEGVDIASSEEENK